MVREPESVALMAAVEGRLLGAASSSAPSCAAQRPVPEAPRWQGGSAARNPVLVRLEAPLLDSAGRMEPPALRSLDAIHVQSALVLGEQLEALVTYTSGWPTPRGTRGLRVLTPG